MPIREFLAGKSFDPETLDVLNEAFHGACIDLGVTDATPHTRTAVAREVLRLAADGNAQHIRAAVVTFLRGRH